MCGGGDDLPQTGRTSRVFAVYLQQGCGAEKAISCCAVDDASTLLQRSGSALFGILPDDRQMLTCIPPIQESGALSA